MKIAAVAAFSMVLVGCSLEVSRNTVFVPESLTDCPLGAKVPPGLPPVIGPVGLRAAYDRTEPARARDHLAAWECRRTLHEVIAIIADFNEQHRPR